MRAINLTPPVRFLVRGSACVILMLTLWWLVPFSPLLFLLRTTAGVAGTLLFGVTPKFTITESDNGDWAFHVPLDATLPRTRRRHTPQPIDSIDFDMARADTGAFTFGLPVFWGLVLAAGDLRRNLRPLLLGTLAMAASEVALLLLTAQILARDSLAPMLRSHDAVGAWLLKFGQYFSESALPYVLPFVIALGLHRGLRQRIFHWAVPVAGDPPAEKARNGSRIDRKKSRAKRR